MVNITLSIPEELKSEMEKFPEINWSEVARAAIRKKAILLREFNNLLKENEFTEEDAIELGRKINKKASKEILKKLNLKNEACG